MKKNGKTFRIIAIIFMGLTAAMNVLGGAGTSCAAFSNSVAYKMAFRDLLDYRWLYQALVVTTVLIGIAGIWATVRLVRGGPTVYRDALIILVIGTILGGIQFYASMTLRGKATPANVKFYLNVVTLVVFLLLKAPGIRDTVDFSSPGSSKAEIKSAAGLTALVAGLVTLTIFSWAGPSHTFYGENWVYVFYTPLIIFGTIFTVGGIATLLWAGMDIFQHEVTRDSLYLAKETSNMILDES